MLEPSQRRLLMESLRPPEGYELGVGIGTTYSLDLQALLFAPLAFTMFDWDDADSGNGREPLALVESLRRYAGRLAIFCQAGQMSIPRRNQPLLSALEESVVQVFAPKWERNALFHPKVWVLRYEPRDKGNEVIRYRLLVMSRNLTLSKSWDAMVSFDGELRTRQKAFSANHPIGDFIRALPGMSHDAVPERILRNVSVVQEEVRRVAFNYPAGVDDARFWALGLAGRRPKPFPDQPERTLVVSPFVGEAWLKSRIGETPGSVLVSRDEELLKLSPSLISKLDCYYLGVPDSAPDSDEEDAQTSLADRSELSGLHAKVFVVDDGWKAHALFGSANATDGAFNLNVEFIVELIGKKSVLGIKSCFDPENDKAGLSPLLVKYQAAPDQGRPDPLDGLRRVAEALKIEIANARLTGTVASSANGDGTYSLTIDSQPGGRPLPHTVVISVWPVTLGESRAVPLKSGEQGIHVQFQDLTVLQLTAFVAVKAAMKDGPDAFPIQFALRIPITGFPSMREEALLRSMLSDASAVARYLTMLLAPEDGQGLGLALGVTQTTSANGTSSKVQDEGLFEALLGALHSDPRRLHYIDKFIRDLRANPRNGEDVLPKRFEEIWAAVMEAAVSVAK